MLRRDGTIEGGIGWSVAPRCRYKAPKRAWPGELICRIGTATQSYLSDTEDEGFRSDLYTARRIRKRRDYR